METSVPGTDGPRSLGVVRSFSHGCGMENSNLMLITEPQQILMHSKQFSNQNIYVLSFLPFRTLKTGSQTATCIKLALRQENMFSFIA